MCLSESGDGVVDPHFISKSAFLGSGVLWGRFDKHIVYLHYNFTTFYLFYEILQIAGCSFRNKHAVMSASRDQDLTLLRLTQTSKTDEVCQSSYNNAHATAFFEIKYFVRLARDGHRKMIAHSSDIFRALRRIGHEVYHVLCSWTRIGFWNCSLCFDLAFENCYLRHFTGHGCIFF